MHARRQVLRTLQRLWPAWRTVPILNLFLTTTGGTQVNLSQNSPRK
jgi:hypothetical protein